MEQHGSAALVESNAEVGRRDNEGKIEKVTRLLNPPPTPNIDSRFKIMRIIRVC